MSSERDAAETIVGPPRAGATVAALVRDLYPGLSWNRARELCRTGRVSVDGEPCLDGARRPPVGAKIRVEPTAPRRRALALEADAIVHVDREIVVVRKPAGLLTLPYRDEDRDTLLSRTRAALRARESEARATLKVVQRLDKDTTGLIVLARTHRAELALRQAFRVHAIERRYLAVVHGRPREGVVETLIVPDRGDGRRGSWGTRPHHRGEAPESARRAWTELRVVERLGSASLVECRLQTGRQHQIRIHLAEAGCPLLGETVYGEPARGGPVVPRIMLHAHVLGLAHPRTEHWLSFRAEPPADMRRLLEELRRRA